MAPGSPAPRLGGRRAARRREHPGWGAAPGHGGGGAGVLGSGRDRCSGMLAGSQEPRAGSGAGGGGGDDRVRLRRGRGGQGGPRRDLPMPGAASPGRPPESLLSISRGRAVPPRARLVVFLLSSSTSSGCFCCRSARAPGAVSRNLMRPNWLFM